MLLLVAREKSVKAGWRVMGWCESEEAMVEKRVRSEVKKWRVGRGEEAMSAREWVTASMGSAMSKVKRRRTGQL